MCSSSVAMPISICVTSYEEALRHTTDTDFVHALDAGFLVFGHFQMFGAPAAKVRIKHAIGLQN
jgi:sugar phosphate permease